MEEIRFDALPEVLAEEEKSTLKDPLRFEAVTELSKEVKNFKLEWTIKNFSSWTGKEGQRYESPKFNLEIDGILSAWNIRLYPCGRSKESSNYICAFLIPMDKQFALDTSANFRFGLFNSKKELIDNDFGSRPVNMQAEGKVILKDELLKELVDESLEIVCDLELCYVKPKSRVLSDLFPQSSLFTDSLWEDGEFSDVTISVSGTEFLAHKIILAAKSPVFSSMFKQEMKEAMSNRVEISDIKPETFRLYLKYIYTGIIDADAIDDDLMVAADKYGVEDLKALCEEVLSKKITPENCIEKLTVSHLHSAAKLKRETINFIIKNSPDLTLANGWAELKETNSIFIDLIEAFINQAPRRKVFTELPTTKRTLLWKIVNVSFCRDDNYHLDSPFFHVKHEEKWGLRFEVKKGLENKSFVNIFLLKSPRFKAKEIQTKFSFSLRNIRGEEISHFSSNGFKIFSGFTSKNGAENLVIFQDILTKITEDTLHLLCTFEVLRDSSDEIEGSKTVEKSANLFVFNNNFAVVNGVL